MSEWQALDAAAASLPVRGAWIEIRCVPQAQKPWVCRSPCGERGLKFLPLDRYRAQFCRSPCGERGLKCSGSCRWSDSPASLPVRGAWIEICASSPITYSTPGRSPCGERGLKYAQFLHTLINNPSLPVRGAWIEMLHPAWHLNTMRGSLPVRGAWIEMPLRRFRQPAVLCRSPCGERGLKYRGRVDLVALRQSLPVRGAWIEIVAARTSASFAAVAPRAGSVD